MRQQIPMEPGFKGLSSMVAQSTAWQLDQDRTLNARLGTQIPKLTC
jgi:hypothetical protein